MNALHLPMYLMIHTELNLGDSKKLITGILHEQPNVIRNVLNTNLILPTGMQLKEIQFLLSDVSMKFDNDLDGDGWYCTAPDEPSPVWGSFTESK